MVVRQGAAAQSSSLLTLGHRGCLQQVTPGGGEWGLLENPSLQSGGGPVFWLILEISMLLAGLG